MESVNLLSLPVTTVNDGTQVEDLIMVTGKKVAAAEEKSKQGLSEKELTFKEKRMIEEDLKSEIREMLKSNLVGVEHGVGEPYIVGHLFRLAETKGDDSSELKLESLRCLYWLLKSGVIIPKESTIINSLKVVDTKPNMNILHFIVKILSEIASSEYCYLSKVLWPRKKKKDYWTTRSILADNNGPIRVALALSNVAPSIECDIEPYEFIVKQLHPWFISLRKKLFNSVPKENVSALLNYFTTVLLEQENEHHNAGRYIRNILTILLNFQSDADQQKYISNLVSFLDGALEVKPLKLQQTLLILVKLAGRGKCGMIRRTDDGAILDHLIRICLSPKDSELDSEIIEESLQLLIFLYESPKFLKQHAAMKTEEFIKFLIKASDEELHPDASHKIMTYLFLNDPKNAVLRRNIPREDKNMPRVLISLLTKVEEDEQAHSSKKHLSKEEKAEHKERRKTTSRHSCYEGKSKTLSLLTLAWFAFSYLKDSAMDLALAVDKLVLDKGSPLLAWLLMFFAIVPAFICNYVSLKNFYSASPLYLQISLEGHVPRFGLMKYVFPWRFDTKKHTIFNIMTLLQLHPVITAIEILCHHVQERGNILASQYELKRLSCLEAMLENIPCLLIKIIQLAAQIEQGLFKWSSVMNIYEIFTILNSVFSLSKSFLDLEIRGGLVDLSRYQIRNISQKASLFLGYFTMISSRILMFLVLEARFGMQVFVIVVLLHMLMTFVIHLLTYSERVGKDGNYDDKHYVFIKRFDLRLFPFTLSEGFIVLLRNPMEFLGVYSSYRYRRRKREFFGIYFLHLAEVLVINLWFVIPESLSKIVGDKTMFVASLLSIGLFLLSGVIFVIYFFVVHPNKKETYRFVAEDKYQESRHIKSEHDVDWKNRLCLREQENFNINGTKLANRDRNSLEISLGEGSDIEENYTTQKSKFKIGGKSYKIIRHGSRESEHSL